MGGGILTGHNTDYAAVARLIADIDPATRFVLRGSGGMAKAVTAALRDAGFRDGTIVARNSTAGKALAALYGFRWRAEPGDEPAGLLLNVTPIGMTGSDADALPFSEELVSASDVVMDVVQYPPETRLLRMARATGKRVITGAEIATFQALDQFVLYTGMVPNASQIAESADFARANG